MARVTDAILSQKAFSRGATQQMVDLSFGGQNGFAYNPIEWVSNQAYVRRNLVCILLEAPRFMSLMPEPDKWVQTLKCLVELHALSIDGFNAELTVETAEHAVGGAGETQQEYTDVKRARSEPEFLWVEKAGMPIGTFLSNWITYGMMDPDTKSAMVGTLDGKRPDDLLPDWYTMSCLFFEPDPTHRKVMKSWVTTNMFPLGSGPIIGKRDLRAASDVQELPIKFTGLSQFNLGGNVFAQKILDNINITNASPNLRPSFITKVSPDVEAATMGYKKEAEDLGKESIVGIARR
jgi:hypothetical protein